MSDISNIYIVPEARPVPGLLLEIFAIVDSLTAVHGCPYVVVGATARDLLLHHVFGVPVSRATCDVDLAIAVENWEQFHSLRRAFIGTGQFTPDKTEHRIYFAKAAIPVDLIPFGGLAENETIAWPPTRDTLMSVAGFEDALKASVRVQVATNLTIPVVSLASLTILKLFAWQDRNTTDKDALDLFRILSKYVDASNEDRLYASANSPLEKFGFQLDLSGAALAGADAREISSIGTLEKLRALISTDSFVEKLAERIRSSRWPFEPDKLAHIRTMLNAYFDELMKHPS